MWYKIAKQLLAGYSTELGYLKNYLKNGTDPYDYPQKVHEYLGESEPEDVYESGREWVANAPQDKLADYREWLNESGEQVGGYYDPAYEVMRYKKMLKPQWMTHFTDNADDIEQNGFQYGHPDLEGVHLTTYKTNRQKEPGYNFAFPSHSRDAINAAGGKYGSEAAIFYGGGIETRHDSDEEDQAVFWGQNIDKSMIFPIKLDGNGDWYVTDYTGRELITGKTYAEAAQWVRDNYKMLQNARNKAKDGKK